MPLTLLSTAGGATSNSYASVAEATAYLEGRLFAAAWTAATVAQQEQALVYATTLLDRERWRGAKGITSTGALTQALAWPRRWAGTLEQDAPSEWVAEFFVDTATVYYSSLTVPAPIVRATAELALELLKAGDTDPFGKDGTRNVRRKTVDVLTTEYVDASQRARGLAIYPNVLALIAPLLRDASGRMIERV